MDFTTLAYAQINLNFDRDKFIAEYDKCILPNTRKIANGKPSIDSTVELNKIWQMVDPTIYELSDRIIQTTDLNSLQYVENKYPAWKMCQLMELDTTNMTDPYLIRYAKKGGSALRNETLDKNFNLKKDFEKLEIVKWIYDNLPFEKINSIHCVSIEKNGFATIHRDNIGLYSCESSAGENKVYQNGFIIVNLNISNGGVPLYWSLGGHDAENYKTVDDPVYITNDYFPHGVPVCQSRRRQIRITGIPKYSMKHLINSETVVTISKLEDKNK